jgi:hypothetical protein
VKLGTSVALSRRISLNSPNTGRHRWCASGIVGSKTQWTPGIGPVAICMQGFQGYDKRALIASESAYISVTGRSTASAAGLGGWTDIRDVLGPHSSGLCIDCSKGQKGSPSWVNGLISNNCASSWTLAHCSNTTVWHRKPARVASTKAAVHCPRIARTAIH